MYPDPNPKPPQDLKQEVLQNKSRKLGPQTLSPEGLEVQSFGLVGDLLGRRL